MSKYKTFNEKYDALRRLYPVYDWVYLKLEKMMEPLREKQDAYIAEHWDTNSFFFNFEGDGLTDEERALFERLVKISDRRDRQISERRKAIYDSLSWEEGEQLIPS